MADFTVLGICGSLRKGSYNRMLLRAAGELMPKEARLEVAEIGGLPPYDADLEADTPEAVRELKAKVKAADAVLFVSPEYNYSVPGVLKNAIDWASRPPSDSAWTGKPAAIMGASTGRFGTVRMQHHLRQVLVGFDMRTICKPEVMVAQAAQQFDKYGRLTDERTKELIGQLLTNLVALSKTRG